MTTQLFIKNLIKENGLKEGDFLPTEKELSDRLGISRTAIREALKGLESLGITKAHQGKGHYIRKFNYEAALLSLDYFAQIDLKGFKDLLEVRINLEPTFLARDIEKFTEEDIYELNKLVLSMEKKAAVSFDEVALSDEHRLFHEKLFTYVDNGFLLELMHMFSVLQHKLSILHGYNAFSSPNFITCHREIVKAITLRQPEIVKGALITHYSDTYKWVDSNTTS